MKGFSGMQLIVYTSLENRIEDGRQLAEKLHCPFTEDRNGAQQNGLFLEIRQGGLILTDGNLEVQGDLTKSLPRLKKNNLQQEMLVKASKMKGADHPLRVIDATAGFGEDSILLAAAGFDVDLYEYDPVIAALLEDSLKRAKEIPELAEIVGRMHLHVEDSVEALKRLAERLRHGNHAVAAPSDGTESEELAAPDEYHSVITGEPADNGDSTEPIQEIGRPDVILLDPMFPARSKSGLIKKKFQLLQQLESPCSNEEELFQAALAVHPGKIVIKRPAKGPFLAGKKPSYSLPGKAIRYDCIVLPD